MAKRIYREMDQLSEKYKHLTYTLVIRTKYYSLYLHRPFIISGSIYGGSLSEEYAYWCAQEVSKCREVVYSIHLGLIDTDKNIKIANAIIDLQDSETFISLKNKCLRFYNEKTDTFHIKKTKFKSKKKPPAQIQDKQTKKKVKRYFNEGNL